MPIRTSVRGTPNRRAAQASVGDGEQPVTMLLIDRNRPREVQAPIEQHLK